MSKKNTAAAVAIEAEAEAPVEAVETVETTTVETPAAPIDVSALMSEHKSKSAVIRHLASTGMTRGAIAKTLKDAGVLSEKSAYQHVRNVLTQPLKKAAS